MAQDTKIVGVMERDPFDYLTWSGSSKYFFNAFQRSGHLYTAIAAEPSKTIQSLYKLYNFSSDMMKWKFKFNTDIGYYGERTKVALREISKLKDENYNVILQVGAKYDLTERKNISTVSYHDSNFKTLISSPFRIPRVSRTYVNKVLDYEKNIFKKIDHIFTMSRWLANVFIKDIGIASSKITPVGAGINLPYTREVNEKRYDEHNILFIGKEFERKGGYVLLQAFQMVRKDIKNVTLTIIGPNLKNLPEGVRCLGFVSKFTEEGLRTLLNEYVSASIFVMPSLYEPFGVVFLEAMAHKLPCIGTSNCAMSEIIDDGINGYLVPVHDTDLLAKRMLDLLKDPKLCKRMGDMAYKKYLDNYTWDIVARRIVDKIRDIR